MLTTRQSLAKPEKFASSQRNFAMRDLWRLALWGLSAAGALALVVHSGATENGRERMHLAFAEIHDILFPSATKAIRPLDAWEGRRLAETVRALAADRERMFARVATLEQSIDDITGSIARVEKATRAPSDATAAPAETAPPPHLPESDTTASVNAPVSVWPPPAPVAPQPPAPNVAPTEFGLDLGNASTVEALRTAWTAAVRRHGPLLEGLRPVVQMRERPRAIGIELRLIAGPLPNAAAAARLCRAMTAAGAICAPTLFDGQRLAGR
jgi:hypothetical protein